MKQLQKIADKYLKQLNGAVTYENAVASAEDMGYTVMYYSDEVCSAMLEKCNLIELSKKYNALTYSNDSANFMFIKDSIGYDDALCAIYHEIVHILLGHLSLNPYIQNERRNEMQAEALAYAILNYK